jgi:hypothetical protein
MHPSPISSSAHTCCIALPGADPYGCSSRGQGSGAQSVVSSVIEGVTWL